MPLFSSSSFQRTVGLWSGTGKERLLSIFASFMSKMASRCLERKVHLLIPILFFFAISLWMDELGFFIFFSLSFLFRVFVSLLCVAFAFVVVLNCQMILQGQLSDFKCSTYSLTTHLLISTQATYVRYPLTSTHASKLCLRFPQTYILGLLLSMEQTLLLFYLQ